jgi:ankyrin repeat protein
MASRNPTPDRRTIDELIQAGEWDLVRDFYENHPESVIGYKDARGATALHAFCRISSTPVSLIQYVVDTWPEALTIQENRFGATPLHLLCWSSQRSRQKVEVLLERMKPSDLMIRNRILGSTPLHSACGNNAELPVIKAIVRKHPPVLLAKTYDQQATAIAALWHSHLQTIPGDLI